MWRRFTLCLDNDGICYGFGNNWYGQCGVGKTVAKILSPKAIDSSTNYKVIKIKAGVYHNYICSEDGNHFLFGRDNYNQYTLSGISFRDKVISPFIINDKLVAL